MMNIQTELNKYGYRAEKSYDSAGIDIYKNGEKIANLSGDELTLNNTPEKIWELIKTKLNI